MTAAGHDGVLFTPACLAVFETLSGSPASLLRGTSSPLSSCDADEELHHRVSSIKLDGDHHAADFV